MKVVKEVKWLFINWEKRLICKPRLHIRLCNERNACKTVAKNGSKYEIAFFIIEFYCIIWLNEELGFCFYKICVKD